MNTRLKVETWFVGKICFASFLSCWKCASIIIYFFFGLGVYFSQTRMEREKERKKRFSFFKFVTVKTYEPCGIVDGRLICVMESNRVSIDLNLKMFSFSNFLKWKHTNHVVLWTAVWYAWWSQTKNLNWSKFKNILFFKFVIVKTYKPRGIVDGRRLIICVMESNGESQLI